MNAQRMLLGIAVTPVLLAAPVALAGAHTWDVVEVFSNSDGTIQFIEIQECCGLPNEIGLGGKAVTSNTSSYVFPSNLIAGTTANKHVLLATAGFAALPGAPTPDHIIADNFFDLDSDLIEYHIYDDFSFSAGQLPTNGKDSLHRLGSGATNHGPGPNTPTNCNGESATLDLCPWDTDGDGNVGITDFLDLLAQWNTNPGGPPDFDGDGNVGITDFLALLANWGPC